MQTADVTVTDGWLTSVPEAYQQAAARLGRQLVALRGGALFLSPADTAALLRWFDAGVPLVRIQRALEAAADRRRRLRVPGPLTLRHADWHLKRDKPGTTEAVAIVSEPGVDGAMERIVGPLLRLELSEPLRRAAQRLAIRLRALPDDEELPEAALDVIAAWFAETWVGLGEQGQQPWRDLAAQGLLDILEALDEGTVEELVEEHARGLLRAAMPPVTATFVLRELGA